jgi:ubiquinone/menaquinone biosynthesis C-methylase UbiE
MKQKWPKTFEPLSAQQEWISDDFVKYWHEVLPKKYGIINKFNHSYVIENQPREFLSTLEIGCGDGEHISYEVLNHVQIQNYVATDIRQNMVDAFKQNHKHIACVVGDIETTLPYPEGSFDREIAIHVLEHLRNLPAAVKEMHRLINKNTGELAVVIPCEGSIAYGLARRISAQRIFQKRYRSSYKWFIEREHVSRPNEIIEELEKFFVVTKRDYFPFPLPVPQMNLVIGMILKPKFNTN